MPTEPEAQALIPEQRQRLLLERLRASGVLRIHDLSTLLGVSHMTVRRDIAALQQSGAVVSVQGGVRLATGGSSATPNARPDRAVLEMPAKQAIAASTAALLEDASVVFLDAGTTCQAVAGALVDRVGLTVVTNDFSVVQTLAAAGGVSVLHAGGTVDHESGSTDGPIAARMLAGLAIDVAVLSTGAWSLERGITTPSLDKVLLKRAALQAASTVLLAADSTKYGASALHRAVELEEVDVVVSDGRLAPDARRSIAELDLRLELAPLRRS